MKIAIISGGFDPVHKGHLELIDNVTKLNPDKIICIVNTDDFLINKKGYYFQDLSSRMFIMEHIKNIDEVVKCIDSNQTVCDTLEEIRKEYPDDILMFCNGGDRNDDNIPEYEICKKNNIEMVFSLGSKVESSSRLVDRIRD